MSSSNVSALATSHLSESQPCRSYAAGLAWALLVIGFLASIDALIAERSDTPSRQNTGPQLPQTTSPPRRDLPLRVRPTVSRVFEVTSKEHEQFHQQILPPTLRNPRPSTSYLLHVLRVHGLDRRFDDIELPFSADILAKFVDWQRESAYWANAPAVRTPFGWRFPTGGPEGVSRDPSLEYHRDQTLAAFGELGIALTHPIRIEGERGTLGDVLSDSIANFDTQQAELAWTLLAYSLYLPPTRSWTNRYNESFTFDDLAVAALSRPLDQESCGGSHLLYSLTILFRVDCEHHVLSECVRSRLHQSLNRAVKVAVAMQEPDGSWHSGWNHQLLPGTAPVGWSYLDAKNTRLIMTGHLTEWFIYLPPELHVPDEVLIRACTWLKGELLSASVAEKESDFCPFTHATCVLRRLAYIPETTPNRATD